MFFVVCKSLDKRASIDFGNIFASIGVLYFPVLAIIYLSFVPLPLPVWMDSFVLLATLKFHSCTIVSSFLFLFWQLFICTTSAVHLHWFRYITVIDYKTPTIISFCIHSCLTLLCAASFVFLFILYDVGEIDGFSVYDLLDNCFSTGFYYFILFVTCLVISQLSSTF